MVSVCMATYNGEKYIIEQIRSILSQLQSYDELIISDDGSTDDTIRIIKSIPDARIKLFQNSFKNVVKNFEFSISQSVGDYIFLSDQDDLWHPKKVDQYLQTFQASNADLIVSNVAFINAAGISQPEEFYKQGFKAGTWENLKKNNFIGCAMAFKKHTKQWFLPFPEKIPMHDWWIGLVIGKKGTIKYIEEKLLFYRRHDHNVTSGKKSTFANIISWRWLIIKNLF